MGKTLAQDTTSNTSITFLEHYIPASTDHISDLSTSPRQVPLVLIPCQGCTLNSYYPYDLRPKCVVTNQTRRLNIFKVHKLKSREHKNFSNSYDSKYFVATKPLFNLRYIAFSVFLHNEGKLVPESDTQLTISAQHVSTTTKNVISQIGKSINCHQTIKTRLIELAVEFAPYNQFHFYTDGSVKHLSSQQCKSGFGWVQTLIPAPRLEFNGSTIFFPSSYKSESMGILTALLTLPYNSNCIISTDSANCIHTFRQLMNSPTLSPRRQLKQNNFLIWNLIVWIIHNRNITVVLKKVKAHSHDIQNDRADALASAGAELEDPIVVDHRFFSHTSMGFVNWNDIYIVDRNIRKWSDTPIQASIFNSLVNNSSLKPVEEQIKYGEIDWYYTRLWLLHNPLDSPTSAKFARIQGTKTKKSTFSYPTADILQRNYPKLYPSGLIKCPDCNLEIETNTHIGLCSAHFNDMNTVLKKHKIILAALLTAHTTSFTFDIIDRLNASPIFKILHNLGGGAETSLPLSHPSLLLLYNLIPTELTSIFYNYLGSKATRDPLLIRFVDDLIRDLNHVTWKKRGDSFKKWENSLNINRRDKLFYNKRHGKKNQNKRRQRNHDRSNNICRSRCLFNGLPYNKTNPRLNDKAHIRWTSSNFLHSGTWESHRDNLLFNDIDIALIFYKFPFNIRPGS